MITRSGRSLDTRALTMKSVRQPVAMNAVVTARVVCIKDDLTRPGDDDTVYKNTFIIVVG